MKPTTIILDWHGVLDRVTFEALTKKISQLTKLDALEIRNVLHTQERLYAAGLIEPAEFWQSAQKILSLENADVTKLKKYILSFHLNTDLWSFLTPLKHTSLAILSDCPQDKLDEIYKHVDLSIFAFTHFSCEKKLVKSDDRFFLNLVQELQVTPKECLYVDDSLKHIETAKRLGFQTCLFTNTIDIKNCLV